MKVKTTLVAVFLVLVLSVGAVAVGVSTDLIETEDPLVISFWGDSIAEGVLGASPLLEHDYYTYGSIVGSTNGYEFHNRSVSGHKVGQFYEYITRTGVFEDERIDNGPMMTGTLIRTSDVIGISILGNDLLAQDLYVRLKEAAVGNYADLEADLQNARTTFYQTIDFIREVNPDAVILMQTVYNPLFEGTLISQSGNLLLTEERIREFADMGVDSDAIRMFGNKIISKLNAIIWDYLAENPGAFEVVDVWKEFDRIYNEDKVRGKNLFYTDGMHPSNEGHAVMADLYQSKLIELGLAKESKALKNYKKLRTEQLDRLFGDSDLDLDAIKADIKSSDDFKAVTNTYFRAIEGVTPVCSELPDYKGKDEYWVEETEKYYFTDNCTINPGTAIPVGLFLDENRSFIELNPDGTIKLELRLPEGTDIGLLINSLAKDVDFSEIDLTMASNQYIYSLLPGFTFDDIEASIGLLKTNIGLEFDGLDFEYKGLQEISESLATNRRLPAKLDLDPEMELCIRYTGTYSMKKVTSSVTGEEYEVINIDKHLKGGDSYIIACKDIDPETGKDRVYFRIDFLWMYAEALAK